MTSVVCGPTYTKFTSAVTNIVEMRYRLDLSAAEGRSRDRGYVSQRAKGVMVWSTKYGGKMAFWSVENCARGRARYAVIPPMKDWKKVEPRRVP
jgi:hypothetical protein